MIGMNQLFIATRALNPVHFHLRVERGKHESSNYYGKFGFYR